MGKAARLRAKRPPPVGKQRPLGERTRPVLLGTSALIAAVVVAVVVLLATRSPGAPPPAATVSAADRNAPASLVTAAGAVGFHPTTEPGVGQVESQPASAAEAPSNPNLLAVGSTAPAFTLETPEGRQVSLARLRGKAVLLEFFATWCPHCDAEAPHLRRLYASLPRRRYAFVSVNADGENAASVFAFHRYFGLQFPGLLDSSSQPGSFSRPGAPGPVTNSYRVQTYPTFYVIDRAGRIAWRSDGEQPDALLRQELASAAS
jgi:peroxiredoxin